jgi:hypothetical protein
MQCYTNLSHLSIKWVKGLCDPHGKNSIVEVLCEIPWPEMCKRQWVGPLAIAVCKFSHDSNYMYAKNSFKKSKSSQKPNQGVVVGI